MKFRPRIGLFLLAVTLAAGLAWGFLPRPIPVEMTTVARGPLRVTVEEEGRTRVKERYVIAAPVSGELRRITLKPGDGVSPGQVLAEIEPAAASALDPRARAQATARLAAAQAALTAAEEEVRAAAAQAALARQRLDRASALHARGFLSAQALDEARTEARRSEASLAAARANRAVAHHERDGARAALVEGSARPKAVSPFRVRSPVAGRILRLARESAGPVQAGQPLLELGDPQELEAEVEVISSQAVRIAPGTPVELTRWGGPPLAGRVRVVEPTAFTKVSALGVEEQRVRVIVDFTADPEARRGLGDGYRVEARFLVWEGRDVLQIPASSLIRHDGGWAVFRVRDGRAWLAPVRLGQRAGLVVEVLSGLAVGERIVTRPDDRLKEGIRVRAQTEATG